MAILSGALRSVKRNAISRLPAIAIAMNARPAAIGTVSEPRLHDVLQRPVEQSEHACAILGRLPAAPLPEKLTKFKHDNSITATGPAVVRVNPQKCIRAARRRPFAVTH